MLINDDLSMATIYQDCNIFNAIKVFPPENILHKKKYLVIKSNFQLEEGEVYLGLYFQWLGISYNCKGYLRHNYIQEPIGHIPVPKYIYALEFESGSIQCLWDNNATELLEISYN